jgi:hypothetical protein
MCPVIQRESRLPGNRANIGLPRFAAQRPTALFHLSAMDRWERVQQEGLMRPSKEDVVKHLRDEELKAAMRPLEKQGIFTFERSNFLTRWLQERTPVDGFTSVADYFLKRVMRQIAQTVSQTHTAGGNFMKAPWPTVLNYLREHPECHSGAALMKLEGPALERVNAVRSMGFTFNQNPDPNETDDGWNMRFVNFLKSYRPLQAYLETGEPAHVPLEFIFPEAVPVSEGILLARTIPVAKLVALFPGDGDYVNPEAARQAFFPE